MFSLYRKSTILGCLALTFILLQCHPGLAQNFTDLEEPGRNEAPSQPKGDTNPNSDDVQSVIALTKKIRTTPAQDENYSLDKTDVIEVSVMRHPEVSGRYTINSEGKIQYEFVGDIVVGGMTKGAVAKIIADKLKDYVINPEVTVKIAEYNSKVVYVVGEVYRPGKIFMRGNTITIREALLEAGLPLLSGITKKSKLITPSLTGKGNLKAVNVYTLLYEGDLRENFTMKPGDILYIPPTLLTKTMRAISPITTPVADVAGTGRGVVAPY